MPQQRPSQGEAGVAFKPSPNKKMTKDYTESDMKALFSRGQWHNWNEAIDWLKKSGERDNELTPGEVIAMVEDLEKLQKSGAAFTNDPAKAFELAHRGRKAS